MDKSQLIRSIGESIQLFQEATDAFDYVAAQILGLNQTDLKCLGIIARKSPVSANVVARGSGLTRGAATTALDRIEAVGLIRRIPDPNDRRGVLLEVTPKCLAATKKLWGQLALEGNQLLSRYTHRELEVIQRFLGEATQLQHKHTEAALRASAEDA